MGIRLDSGVTEGQEITAYYASMLAKLVAWGPDRKESTARRIRALQSFPVLGIATNIPFLLRALAHPGFSSGEYDTGFISKHDELTAPPEAVHLNKVAADIAERIWEANGSSSTRRDTTLSQVAPGPWHGLPKSMFP